MIGFVPFTYSVPPGGGGIVAVPVLAVVVPAAPTVPAAREAVAEPARVAVPAPAAVAEPVVAEPPVVTTRVVALATPGVVLPLVAGRVPLVALPAPAVWLPTDAADPIAAGVRATALPAAFGLATDDPPAAATVLLAVVPVEAVRVPLAVAVVSVPPTVLAALIVDRPSPPGPAQAVSTVSIPIRSASMPPVPAFRMMPCRLCCGISPFLSYRTNVPPLSARADGPFHANTACARSDADNGNYAFQHTTRVTNTRRISNAPFLPRISASPLRCRLEQRGVHSETTIPSALLAMRHQSQTCRQEP